MPVAKFHEVLIAQGSAEDVAGSLGKVLVSAVRELAVYVVFSPGTSAGAVAIKGAHDLDFTGTWANIGTVTWAAANRVHHVAVTGVHLAVRARISTAIEGGTVDVLAVGN